MRAATGKGTVVALASLLLALILSACGGGPASSEPSITLYNGQHVQTTASLVTAFEKQTGIHVNVRSNDEDVFANQIVQDCLLYTSVRAKGAHRAVGEPKVPRVLRSPRCRWLPL